MGKTKQTERAAQTVQTEQTNDERTIRLSDHMWERIVRLAETATVKQTTEQVLATVLHQGLKTIEKRRETTTENRLERAEALLRAAGKIA